MRLGRVCNFLDFSISLLIKRNIPSLKLMVTLFERYIKFYLQLRKSNLNNR
jgi:hypothetical protein